MLLVRIEDDGQVRFKNITTKKGEQMSLPQQTVWVFGYDVDGNIDRHPYRSQITLAKGQQPYGPGDYTIHPSVSRFTVWGQSYETNLRLIPVDEFVQLLKKNLFSVTKHQESKAA